MHDAAFAAAARPARFVILGLPMKPYSIGHEILLLNQGNPLLSGSFDTLDATAQRQAVIRACLVCSQSWLENLKPQRWLRLWMWKNRRADYALAIADFKNYRAEGSCFPKMPEKEAEAIAAEMNGEEKRKGRELGSPYLARLCNFIAGFTNGYSETVFDFSMSLANFIYLTHLECQGDLKIENRQEAEIREEMAGHRAAFVKEKEAEKCQH